MLFRQFCLFFKLKRSYVTDLYMKNLVSFLSRHHITDSSSVSLLVNGLCGRCHAPLLSLILIPLSQLTTATPCIQHCGCDVGPAKLVLVRGPPPGQPRGGEHLQGHPRRAHPLIRAQTGFRRFSKRRFGGSSALFSSTVGHARWMGEASSTLRGCTRPVLRRYRYIPRMRCGRPHSGRFAIPSQEMAWWLQGSVKKRCMPSVNGPAT